MNPIEDYLLKTAGRRAVSASLEARLTGYDIAKIRRAIQSLVRRNMLYESAKPIRNYFGSTEAEYRRTR